MTVFSWLQKRERGIKHLNGEEESIHRSVYSSVQPYSSWNNSDAPTEYGGVYNLEFSPDGSLLVAACEKRAVVLFDPITNRQTKAIKNAHQDCVNCVKFLDNRMFATCSDDATIALWDTRNLKTKIRSLHGHMNWVKNIEYSRKESLLVTSGFDGSVFTWDINSYTEQGLIYQRVFHTPGLMRCRLSPDATKLVISTTGGYLIIVHNLDLNTLAKDLNGFRPNIYRLMQMGRQYIPYAASFDYIFSKAMKKNRVELASDFPAENDAEVISALQIHPHGWCALTRNISYDESSEWTCVHDIQEWDYSDTSESESEYQDEECSVNDSNDDENHENYQSNNITTGRRRRRRVNRPVKRVRTSQPPTSTQNLTNAPTTTTTTTNTTQRHRSNRRSNNNQGTTAAAATADGIESNSGGGGSGNSDLRQSMPNNQSNESSHPDIWAAEVTVRDRMLGNNRRRNSTGTFGNTHVYGISSGVVQHHQQQQQQDSQSPTSNNSDRAYFNELPDSSLDDIDEIVQSVSPVGIRNRSSANELVALQQHHQQQQQQQHNRSPQRLTSTTGGINQNVRRMLKYIEEPNKGKGFIKELCFSSDGRVICSPYAFGFRLLAFSENCSELPRTLLPSGEAQPLVSLKYIKCHSDIVVSTKFSPCQPLFATGCLRGKVVWHQPKF